jgi:hypothetical protein
MANTLYFAAYPSAASTPTWARANIGTNAGFSGTPTMYGTHAAAPASGTNYEPTISWTGSLTPGTPYKFVALWDDGIASSNGGAVFVGEVFTALTLAELAATGATGAFLGAASSPAVATLAATGTPGAFSGTASSPTTTTLAATGQTGNFAALAVTGETGTFAGAAGASSSATLAAAGGTGTFSGSAYSNATALLAAAGNSGIFTGSAFSPAIAALATTGGTGAFYGSASTQAFAELAAAGATGAFSGEAWTLGTTSLDATGGSGTFAGSASVPSGTADAADVWNYVLSNGKSAEQTAVEIHAMLLDLHRIHGLELGSPLTVTETSRQAGAVLQAISEAAGAVVVTRQ